MQRIRERLGAAPRDDGFTLIELLVVILIIGVLTAVAIPVFLSIQGHGHRASVESDVHNFVIALEASRFETASTAVVPPSPENVTLSPGVLIDLCFTAGEPAYYLQASSAYLESNAIAYFQSNVAGGPIGWGDAPGFTPPTPVCSDVESYPAP